MPVLLIADIERIALLILKLNINHLMQCNFNFGFSVKKLTINFPVYVSVLAFLIFQFSFRLHFKVFSRLSFSEMFSCKNPKIRNF